MVATRNSIPAPSGEDAAATTTTTTTTIATPPGGKKVANVLRQLQIDGTDTLKGNIPAVKLETNTYHWHGSTFAVTPGTKREWINEQPERYRKRQRSSPLATRPDADDDIPRSSHPSRKRRTLHDQDHGDPHGAGKDEPPPKRQRRSVPQKYYGLSRPKRPSRRQQDHTPPTKTHGGASAEHPSAQSPQVGDVRYKVLGSAADRSFIEEQRERAAEGGLDVFPLPEHYGYSQEVGYRISAKTTAAEKAVIRSAVHTLRDLVARNEQVRHLKAELKKSSATLERALAQDIVSSRKERNVGERDPLSAQPAATVQRSPMPNTIDLYEKLKRPVVAASNTTLVPTITSISALDIPTVSTEASNEQEVKQALNMDGSIDNQSPYHAQPAQTDDVDKTEPYSGPESNHTAPSSHSRYDSNSTSHTSATSASTTQALMPEAHNSGPNLPPSPPVLQASTPPTNSHHNPVPPSPAPSQPSHPPPEAYKPATPTTDLPQTARGGQQMRWSLPLSQQLDNGERAEAHIYYGLMDGESKSARRRRIRRELNLVRSWEKAASTQRRAESTCPTASSPDESKEREFGLVS